MKKMIILLMAFAFFAFGINSAYGATINTQIQVCNACGYHIPTASKISTITFSGDGFLKSHQVEINILRDGTNVDRITTHTTSKGGLYMPWIVPEKLWPGDYEVMATDKTNIATTKFKI